MDGLDTTINTLFIWLWLAAALIVAVWTYYRLNSIISHKHLSFLIGIRVVAISLFALLLFQPYSIITRPNSDAFQSIILADVSGSMTTPDCAENLSRLEVASNILAQHSQAKLIPNTHSSDVYLFSNQKYPYHPGKLYALPGKSAIGNILETVTTDRSKQKIAAVLLISDGHNNDGDSLTQAAKLCARRSIPVNIIGIGETGGNEDIKLSSANVSLNAVKKESVSLPFSVINSFQSEHEIVIDLYDGDKLIDSQKVVIGSDSTLSDLSFAVTPYEAGLKTYRIVTKSIKDDRRPETNTTYVSVEVKEPDHFKVFYLGAALNWNYKFLKLNSADNDQFSFDAIIKVGGQFYHKSGNTNGPMKDFSGFPNSSDFYNDYDVVVLDTRVTAYLSTVESQSLVNFVTKRGGGLICMGPVDHLNKTFLALQPVRSVDRFTSYTKTYLDIDSFTIFPESSTALLHDEYALNLIPGSEAYKTTDLKPAARVAVSFKGSDNSMLAVHRYGSGRVAYLGSEMTWLWHMATRVDMRRYKTFWDRLFVWLGSTGKPRTKLPFNASVLSLNEETFLDATIYDKTFKPAVDAQVELIITAPDNSAISVPMAMSPDIPGKFSSLFIPRLSGEYRSVMNATFADGTVETQTAFFMVTPSSDELLDNVYRDDILRDVARITGGEFVHYSALTYPFQLKLSKDVPLIKRKQFWSDSWLLLFFILLIPAIEWTFKRKIGLR